MFGRLSCSVWKIELQYVLVAMHLVKFNSTVFGTWHWLARLVASVIKLVY